MATTWTDIGTSDTDQDSPLAEVIDTIRQDLDYLKEHLVRTGVSATGVPLIISRGVTDWSGTTSSGGDLDVAVSVTFADDSKDGDPVFDPSATPIVVFSISENTAGGGTWPAAGTKTVQSVPLVFMDHGSLDYEGFTVTIQIFDWANTTLYRGKLHWIAIMEEYIP